MDDLSVAGNKRNRWDGSPRPQLEPQITSLDKCKTNYSIALKVNQRGIRKGGWLRCSGSTALPLQLWCCGGSSRSSTYICLSLSLSLYLSLYIYIYIHIHSIYIYIYTCMNACMYVCMYVCVYIYIYIYIHMLSYHIISFVLIHYPNGGSEKRGYYYKTT